MPLCAADCRAVSRVTQAPAGLRTRDRESEQRRTGGRATRTANCAQRGALKSHVSDTGYEKLKQDAAGLRVVGPQPSPTNKIVFITFGG